MSNFKKAYKYVELSSRGFSNEIEFVVKCDSKQELETLETIYINLRGSSSRVWAISGKEANKKRCIVEASKLIECYNTNGNFDKESYQQYCKLHCEF